MYNNDYILRMIEDLGRVLRQVFLQEEEEMFEIVDEEGRFSESDFLGYRVGRLLLERRINEAENLLFDEIEPGIPQPSFLAVGVHFYEDLQELSDEELEAADFSREEIAEGLEALKRLCMVPGEEPVSEKQEASSMQDHKPVSIAIDGPSGAGKSTIARILAGGSAFYMWIPGHSTARWAVSCWTAARTRPGRTRSSPCWAA